MAFSTSVQSAVFDDTLGAGVDGHSATDCASCATNDNLEVTDFCGFDANGLEDPAAWCCFIAVEQAWFTLVASRIGHVPRHRLRRQTRELKG